MKSLAGLSSFTEYGVTGEGCAGLLLETVPLVMGAVRVLVQRMEIKELTVPQFRALTFVGRHKGASLSDAAEFLGMTLPSASKMVDQLVKKRWLNRGNDAEDRRRIVLRLTREGDVMLKEAHLMLRERLGSVLSKLEVEEMATLHRALVLLQQSFPNGTNGTVDHRAGARGTESEKE
jgi:DNA-binding MarR family transcriptional regulator